MTKEEIKNMLIDIDVMIENEMKPSALSAFCEGKDCAVCGFEDIAFCPWLPSEERLSKLKSAKVILLNAKKEAKR